MRAPNSPQERRGRRPWLVPVTLSIVILGVAAYFLTREEAAPEPDAGTAPVLAGGEKPGYKARSYWAMGDDGAPAAASIRGTVYDIAGRPIAGARVTASSFNLSGNRSTPVTSAESEADGRFALRLPDGSYYLAGEREGYGSAMAIAHGGDEIGIVLPPASTIKGRVRDEQGRPISRFSVDVISPSIDEMAAPPPFVSKRFESADGSFRLTELPDRPALLRVSAEGYAPTLSGGIRLRAGEEKTQDFTLTAGCTMTGVVVDGAGAPLAEVLVDAELRRSAGMMGAMSFESTSSGETDSDGRFTLQGVPLGDLMIRAYNGTHAVSSITAKLETCADAAPLELVMTGGGGLEGLVRDTAGNPVPGAKISLTHRSIGFVNTTSDAEGRYRFDRLPAGAMRIEAMRGEQHTTAFVTIPEEEIVERELVFSAGGHGEIHGRVTAGDKPVPGISLMVVANEGNGVLGSRHPVTGPDGTYRVTGLPDGAYGVLVASANRLAKAEIRDGSVATADIDISQLREPPSQQQLDEMRAKLAEQKAQAEAWKAEAAAEAQKNAQDDQPEEQPEE